MNLREYQQDLINEINICDSDRMIIVSPCGSGKSIIQAHLAKQYTDQNKRVIFIVHRKELCEQIFNTFSVYGVNMLLCTINMVQTLVRRLERIDKPDLLLIDEAHHSLASSYKKIIEYFNILTLGFTATPVRLGNLQLGNIYKDIIIGKTVKWLTENNYLSPFKYYSNRVIDVKKIKKKNGDYDSDEIDKEFEKNKVYADIIDTYKKCGENKKAIIYCNSIGTSKKIYDRFISEGYKIEHIDGNTEKNTRDNIIKRFRNNQIQLLTNVDILGEGFDVPDCECVIMMRPTTSLALFIQQSMRCLRYMSEKTGIILDHVGNVYTHGLPDMEHEWILEKGKTNNKKNEIEIKECPECYAVIKDFPCFQCGFIPEKKDIPIKVIKEDLIQVTNEEVYRTILYKKPWCYIEKIKTLKEILDFLQVKSKKLGAIYYQLDKRDDIICTIDDFKRWEKLAGYKRGWHKHMAKKYKVYE